MARTARERQLAHRDRQRRGVDLLRGFEYSHTDLDILISLGLLTEAESDSKDQAAIARAFRSYFDQSLAKMAGRPSPDPLRNIDSPPGVRAKNTGRCYIEPSRRVAS
tara:strand:- start:3740 stop:4060 length:321 start_codon:yes stop_codon:yes gene_type:complete